MKLLLLFYPVKNMCRLWWAIVGRFVFIDFSFDMTELEGAIARENTLPLAKSIVPGWINVILTLITRYSSLHL